MAPTNEPVDLGQGLVFEPESEATDLGLSALENEARRAAIERARLEQTKKKILAEARHCLFVDMEPYDITEEVRELGEEFVKQIEAMAIEASFAMKLSSKFRDDGDLSQEFFDKDWHSTR